MGSIVAARRAGRYEESKAVQNRMTATDAITEKSIAPTPYRVVRMVRPASAAPAKPIPSPTAASSDASFRMSQTESHVYNNLPRFVGLNDLCNLSCFCDA
jgi:hypothetical protein